MKRLLIMLSVVGCLLAQDSPVGNWKLSGLKVDYLHVTREDADVFLTDSYWQAFGMPTRFVLAFRRRSSVLNDFR